MPHTCLTRFLNKAPVYRLVSRDVGRKFFQVVWILWAFPLIFRLLYEEWLHFWGF